MELRGAEATLEIGDEKVKKVREPKNYRHQELDDRIRKERTRKEYRIMKDARKAISGIPRLERTSDDTLEIEKVEGDTLKQELESGPERLEEAGKKVAGLHSTDIIHGDLTTSNMIVNGQLHLIDFGLSLRSQRIEDRAVDLHLLKQVLESSHPEVAEDAWQSFISGYSSYEKAEQVLERLEEVEERGRYK